MTPPDGPNIASYTDRGHLSPAEVAKNLSEPEPLQNGPEEDSENPQDCFKDPKLGFQTFNMAPKTCQHASQCIRRAVNPHAVNDPNARRPPGDLQHGPKVAPRAPEMAPRPSSWAFRPPRWMPRPTNHLAKYDMSCTSSSCHRS